MTPTVLNVQPQRLRLVVKTGWWLLSIAERTWSSNALHAFGMATDTRNSVAHRRVARCGIGNNVYRGFSPVGNHYRIGKVVSLQSVWQIEDGFPAIVREI